MNELAETLSQYAYDNAESPFQKQVWISASGTEYSGELAETFALAENAINMLVSDYDTKDLNSFDVPHTLNELLEAIGIIIKELHESKL